MTHLTACGCLDIRIFRRSGHRQMGGEGGALAGDALDRQSPAVPVEDVLDQREPEASAALRTAFGHVDPIETFGQPRQVLGRDAGTVVAYPDRSLARALGAVADRQRDIDFLA